MAWFRNQYLCEDCECEWEDEWSATPDSAEDSADYELIGECGTREAAEKFLKNDNEESERRDGPIGFAD
jgi:hypothetical protein